MKTIMNIIYPAFAAIAQLKSTIAQQMEAVTARLRDHDAQIQKVSAQAELNKFATGRIRRGGPALQTVANR
jgi:hypothetical protein